MLERLRRALRLFGRAELIAAMVTFGIALVLVSAQVAARLVNYSMWWAQEWTEVLIMYAYFLGISHIYKSRHMITMDFLVGRFSRRRQLQMYVFAQFLVIVFCAVVAVEAIRIAPRELAFPSFVVQVPRFYWTLPLIIGSLSMVFTSLYFAVAVVREAGRTDGAFDIHELELRTAIVPGADLEATHDEADVSR